MKPTDETSAIRKKIDDYSYLLDHNIGKGYSSQVFRGRKDPTDHPVAIKVIDMKMIKNQIHKNLLASEIEVLKELKHSENIIQVYDIYTTKNNTYIITELCEGDLSKLISKNKGLSEAEAIPLMNQIINGYINCYNRGIIHRDLKPANIFLKNNQIKIADFGFAMKQVDNKKNSSYNVGSPVYMSPEALKQNKYSFKSDIWALGVIYYEMLTGKTPWRAKTEKELAKQITSVPIKKLLPPSISSSSQTFLLKTLNLDTKDRMKPEDIQNYKLTTDRTITLNSQKQNPEYLSNNLTTRLNDTITDKTNRKSSSLSKNIVHNVRKPKDEMKSSEELKLNTMGTLKTAATISQKSTNFMNTSTNLNPTVKILTQKSINTVKSMSTQLSIKESIKQQVHYDRRQLSKQLLSQIHFCRFMFKLIKRMNEKLNKQTNSELQSLKGFMCELIFCKLEEVEKLRLVPDAVVKDFQKSHDFNKITQIVLQYKQKYTKQLEMPQQQQTNPATDFNQQLTQIILTLYNNITSQTEITQKQEEVIVLDYLITLRQLVALLHNSTIEVFHSKSKIQKIVEGSPSQTINIQHVDAIKTKLKAMKLI